MAMGYPLRSLPGGGGAGKACCWRCSLNLPAYGVGQGPMPWCVPPPNCRGSEMNTTRSGVVFSLIL